MTSDGRFGQWACLEPLLPFYEKELFENILPFWMRNGIDAAHGGFHTCFSNRGDRLLHRHKFTWSQGRFVWMLARLSRAFQGRRPQADLEAYLACAGRGAAFLMKHARLPNGNCAFVLSDAGDPILLDAGGAPRPARPGEAYDSSVYADLFVVYGTAEYSLAADDLKAYQFAAELYESARERFAQATYRSEPYPVPAGYEAHGRPMILLETAHGLSRAAVHFGDARADIFLDQARGFMAEILDKFRDPETDLIAEMYSADPSKRSTMLGRYVNPGHTLESMWFVLHLAERLGPAARIAQALDVIRAVCPKGWDETYGGFPQFLDREGGPPRGTVPSDLRDHEMTRKLSSDWDNKLWWPHTEALYALLLAYKLSGDGAFLDWHRRVHAYTFRTFPNPDRNIGEWIQIRARDGTPVDKVVALPVKDPLHIARAFILCIDLLRSTFESR